MSVLTQKIVQEISDKNIRPMSVWISRFRNSAYWVGAAFLVLFSALATVASFHALFEIDWDAYGKANFSWLQVILSGVPIFSIVLFALFLLVTVYFLHQTSHGYRYPFVFLMILFFSTSVVFGYFIEVSPLDAPVERFLLYALPHTDTIPTSFLPSATRQWSQPEQGLLGGTVLSSSANGIRLMDASQKLWTVDVSSALLVSDVSLEIDQDIKVIGDQEDETTFKAVEIRDWKKSDDEKQREKNSVIEGKKNIEQGEAAEKERHEEERKKDERADGDKDDESESDDEKDEDHDDDVEQDDEE